MEAQGFCHRHIKIDMIRMEEYLNLRDFDLEEIPFDLCDLRDKGVVSLSERCDLRYVMNQHCDDYGYDRLKAVFETILLDMTHSGAESYLDIDHFDRLCHFRKIHKIAMGNRSVQ